ncbi:MAG: triose-phosphate isomerase [Deltaproteobacteria bacterium]|nr:triose-phosphate isomerase [Deltaproteobacteria bacterium]
MTRRPLIAGNWKLQNGLDASTSLARAVAAGIDASTKPEVVIAPVFTALASVATVLRELEGKTVGLAAQDLHWEDKGAFTGEVSAPLLTDVGCTHVIVGHSERRQLFGDTDERVRRKVEAALRGVLTPIACVGETLEEREAGLTLEVVLRQLDAIATNLHDVSRIVLAYEPVWAIGTGRVAKAEDAQDVHHAIRNRVRELAGDAVAEGMRILYGGSVKADNAAGLLSQPDIDGALVGGASLDASQFLAIVAAA